MKVIISEKQLACLIGQKKNVEEEDTTTSTASEPSTASADSSSSSSSSSSDDNGKSPGAEDMPPYPEVPKWESGVERGPANQIAVTKWSDTVGSKLTRGKANPIKGM